MPSMPIMLTTNKTSQKILIEFDADKFERLAAVFGFFSDEFKSSIRRAEKDLQAGRFKKISSSKELLK